MLLLLELLPELLLELLLKQLQQLQQRRHLCLNNFFEPSSLVKTPPTLIKGITSTQCTV